MAVTKACCQAVVCTAALISEGCTLAGSVLQCTVAGHYGGRTSQTDMAVPQACCQAVVCTAALISEGSTLAGSVLQ